MTKFEVLEHAGRFIVGRVHLKTRGTRHKVVPGIKFVEMNDGKISVGWATCLHKAMEKAKSYARRSDAVKLLNKVCPPA